LPSTTLPVAIFMEARLLRFACHGIDLHFHEPFGLDQAAHLHHRVDRVDVPEELAPHFGGA